MFKLYTKKLFDPSFKRHWYWWFRRDSDIAPAQPHVRLISELDEPLIDEAGTSFLIAQVDEPGP